MTPERFRLAVAVYGVLRDQNRVLLMRRSGTGYRDGELGLPAGHLDGGEDAVSGLLRELSEELTITADRESCRLATVMHRRPEYAADQEYLDLFFTVGRWSGTPAIGEPDKCSELVWTDSGQLPADTIDYVRAALHTVATGAEPMVLHGWSTPGVA